MVKPLDKIRHRPGYQKRRDQRLKLQILQVLAEASSPIKKIKLLAQSTTQNNKQAKKNNCRSEIQK